MRITSGSARGIALKAVPGNDTRPTSDMVKQAIFNILQFELGGRNVLDLFAGTGQLGLEALSRGASSAVFVDKAPEALEVIRSNIQKTGFSAQSRVVKSDYKAFLSGAPKKSFDLVLLDPPYREKFVPRILNFIETFDILSDCGIIICETATGERMPARVGKLCLTKQYKYGGTELSVYRVSESGESQ
ncbi:MAG: 16S rRNA (guanine(966)-N(2))-methyltransferase RsmD [Clostridia bacterium]|nr:16S rRNA (guanine(966)-N(2))-methyltransferase RsmD [Clostridia bacterium]